MQPVRKAAALINKSTAKVVDKALLTKLYAFCFPHSEPELPDLLRQRQRRHTLHIFQLSLYETLSNYSKDYKVPSTALDNQTFSNNWFNYLLLRNHPQFDGVPRKLYTKLFYILAHRKDFPRIKSVLRDLYLINVTKKLTDEEKTIMAYLLFDPESGARNAFDEEAFKEPYLRSLFDVEFVIYILELLNPRTPSTYEKDEVAQNHVDFVHWCEVVLIRLTRYSVTPKSNSKYRIPYVPDDTALLDKPTVLGFVNKKTVPLHLHKIPTLPTQYKVWKALFNAHYHRQNFTRVLMLFHQNAEPSLVDCWRHLVAIANLPRYLMNRHIDSHGYTSEQAILIQGAMRLSRDIAQATFDRGIKLAQEDKWWLSQLYATYITVLKNRSRLEIKFAETLYERMLEMQLKVPFRVYLEIMQWHIVNGNLVKARKYYDMALCKNDLPEGHRGKKNIIYCCFFRTNYII